jgi:DNA-directed RNA polymerase subunit RPC12/RpoP
MPIRPPGAYDYYCHHCNHQFRQPFWRRLLGLRALPFAVCPKCSHLAVRLIY